MRTFIPSLILASTLILAGFLIGCDSVDAGDPPEDAPGTVAEVEIVPSAATLTGPETVQLTAVARDAQGNELPDMTFEWTIENSSPASVDATGMVTAYRVGSTAVIATAQGVEGQAQITVVCPEPVQVTSNLTEPTVWTPTIGGCTDYVVHGVRRVEASLVVGPDTWIEFKAGAALHTLTSSDYLAFAGAGGAPIRLFGEVPTPGFWRGIGFHNNDVRNEVTNTIIMHAGIGNLGSNVSTLGNTAIGVRGDARVSIKDSRIEDSAGFGVRATSTGTILEGWANNRFANMARAPVALRASYLRYLDEATNYMDGEPHGEPYVHVPSSEILSLAQTWPDTGIPIRFTSGSRHTISAHLTIRPGATLEFTGAGFSIGSNGALTADGTNGTITFRGATGTPGEWQGLIFGSSTTVNNRFVNVVISDAGGATAGVGGQRSNIRMVQNNRVEVVNSVIRNSDHCGIWVGSNNNTLLESGNTFEDNAGGDICTP